MVIGNPYKFSIFVEKMNEWSNDAYSNGLFLVCINGTLFPDEVFTSTLTIDVSELKENLSCITINKELFELPKKDAFLEMYYKRFPIWDGIDETIQEDYQYEINSTGILDYRSVMFAVSNGEQIRIMATNLNKLSYDKEKSTYDFSSVDISETFITQEEMKEMILELEQVLVNLI